jgi:hypothetical protein
MVSFVVVATYYDTKSASATQSWSTSTTGARTYNANYQKNSDGQWFYGYQGTLTKAYFFADVYPYDDVESESDYDWSSADTKLNSTRQPLAREVPTKINAGTASRL